VPPVEPPRPHPVRLMDDDDLQRSRLTVLVRLLLVIPHLIWLTLYATIAFFVVLFNWIVALFRGRPSDRAFRWLVRFLRYSVFVYAYLNLLANPYPPFHGTEGSYPIDMEADGPERQNRLITLFRIVVAIPALVLSSVFGQVLQIVALLGWFVALALGRLPRGMESLGLYCLRYQTQTWAYLAIVTASYPSLSGVP
jgi:hypothetical protein